MIRNKRPALLVLATLICATKSSPASGFATGIHGHNSRLVARWHGNYSDVADREQPTQLSPEHWRALNLDEYLGHYPNGNSLTLPMYVEQLHLRTKFECGLHKHCSVGPLGDTVSAKDYYVLFATSQWNYYVNSLSRALKSASDLVKHSVPPVIRDFVEISSGKTDAHSISEIGLFALMLGGIDDGGTVQTAGIDEFIEPDYMAALEPLSTKFLQKMLADAAKSQGSAGQPGISTPSSRPSTSSAETQSFSLTPFSNAPDQGDLLSTQEQAHQLADQSEDLDQQESDLGLDRDDELDSPGKGKRPLSVHQALRASQIDGGGSAGGSEVQAKSEDHTGKLEPFKRQQRMQKRRLAVSDIPVWPNVYNSTATVEFNIEALSAQFQAFVDDSFTDKINAPISLDAGIYGALKGGRFLVEHVKPATLLPNAKKTIELITISALLQSQTDCHLSDDLQESDTLSFCSTDGTLAEIVLVEGNSLKKRIFHAQLIQTKYDFSTEFLAAQAWRCDQYVEGKPESPKLKNENFNLCDFYLPVCNLKEPRLARMLDEGSSIVKLCRQVVGLLI